MTRCDEGKTRYPTHAKATKTIISMGHSKWKKGAPQVPLRAYACPFCKLWHITSQVKKDQYIGHMSRNNPELAEKLLRRKTETPIFDTMMRTRPVRGKTFR